MAQLWLFYDRSYQCIDFNEYDFETITIGPEVENLLTLQSFPFPKGAMQIEEAKEGYSVREDGKELGVLSEEASFTMPRKGRALNLFITSSVRKEQVFYCGYENEITFSLTNHSATIYRPSTETEDHSTGFTLLQTEDGWQTDLERNCTLYVNGEIAQQSQHLKIGDIVQWAFMEFQLLEEDILAISSVHDFSSKLPLINVSESEMAKTYPSFRRTPRMIYEAPKDKVSLTFPSQEAEDAGRGLWLIIAPPLVMLTVMGLVAILIPRGVFIIISISMFMMTLVTSTVQYFKEKKRKKLNEEKRRRVYSAYLSNMREELYALATEQKNFLDYHFPPFDALKKMTDDISGRIWERTIESNDFLDLRIGTGEVPSSYDISLSSGDLANREVDDLLAQSQRLESVFNKIPGAPITVNLSKGILGLIGKESIIQTEIDQLIGQLAFFHSYHDVRFVHIFKHEDYAKVEWMKWLPHFTLPHMHTKAFIHNEQTRDQLLSSLYEMIRERDIDENKGKVRFGPHFVFIVSDYALITGHVILEYLEGKDHEALGISVIFTAAAKERITENVHTLVRYVNAREGDILIEAQKAVKKPFELDTNDDATNERFARMLRTLNHQVGITNSIPEAVSFLEMYGVKEVEKLAIEHNWLTNESAKSLAAPVGLKGKEDLVELNLHEKAHGPHGLLAGTTGSGKSEFLQTYILSLAVNFHPHEVAFLLIDYKGGGMAQPFRKIPHLLGTITNIEGSKNFSMRALASINSELKRRQRLFDEFTVAHIDDYTKLVKEGQADEPLPHLFLISDEFAELKSEEPDFIRELVSTARIGRSLGVHLILATQKPGGIIDEQIRSNARFRVALKVQDAADSKEIINNSDAASITVTGRGYLQVGNNEVYELFQSAWSGAPYLEEIFEGEDEIAIVTDLGLQPLIEIASDLGGHKSSITEIEAVTTHIAEVQQNLKVKKLASPWLPPLDLRIAQSERQEDYAFKISIGMIDEPEKQSQSVIHYTMMDDGNMGVFGSPGYGKSYTLLTMLLQMAEQHSPEEIHFYVLDYGNGSLLPLRQLPQTADYFTIDEVLKREKLVAMIKSEITARKLAFQQAEVNHIKMYNKVSDQPLPLLFLVVDNYDIVREEMEAFELVLNQFGRDGQSLGIYLFVSATRAQAVRQSLMNNLKMKIVHYLMDTSEAFNVVGRLPFELEPFAGRAILKKEESYFTQIFMPAKGEDDFEVLEAIKQKVTQLKAHYEDSWLPKPIPMLPLELSSDNFNAYLPEEIEVGSIPLGLDEETVEPVSINFKQNRHCLLLGQPRKGKTNLLKNMLHTLLAQKTSFIVLFDSFDRGLSSFSYDARVSYMETKEQISEWLGEVEQFYVDLEAEYLTVIQSNTTKVEVVPSYFIVDDYSRFLQVVDIGIQDRLSKLMKNYAHLGFNVIVSGNNAEITKGYDTFTNELKQIRQAVIFMKKSEQTLYALAYERKEQELPVGFAYYILNGMDTKIQVPLCTIERKILQ